MREDAVKDIMRVHDYREADVAEAVAFIINSDPTAVQINMFGAIQVRAMGCGGRGGGLGG
jgi:hypothetical protein